MRHSPSPRQRRPPIGERLDAVSYKLAALDAADVEVAIQTMREQGIEAVTPPVEQGLRQT